MFRRTTLLIALSTVVLSGWTCGEQKNCDPPSGANQKILLITFPCADYKVTALQLVKGTVSDPDVKEVWVIIHSMETSDYWVQQKATVEDGRWEVMCHFGEPELHAGKPYEFMAVAKLQELLVNEKGRLKKSDWPKADLTSQLIRQVIRK